MVRNNIIIGSLSLRHINSCCWQDYTKNTLFYGNDPRCMIVEYWSTCSTNLMSNLCIKWKIWSIIVKYSYLLRYILKWIIYHKKLSRMGATLFFFLCFICKYAMQSPLIPPLHYTILYYILYYIIPPLYMSIMQSPLIPLWERLTAVFWSATAFVLCRSMQHFFVYFYYYNFVFTSSNLHLYFVFIYFFCWSATAFASAQYCRSMQHSVLSVLQTFDNTTVPHICHFSPLPIFFHA